MDRTASIQKSGPGPRRRSTRSGPVCKSIDLPGRLRLHYAEQGNPDGVPLVMLHGYSDSWRSFELVMPHLPPWVRAFALSQRGHGDSERPGVGYHPRDFAADVAAFLEVQGLDAAVIAGHSMGSHVGQRFAIEYPQRTLGLALLGSFFRFGANPAVAELRAVVAALTDPVDRTFALEFQKSTLVRDIPPEYLETVVQESLKLPARVWQAVADELLVTENAGHLRWIEAPTLVLWGDRDAYCPRSDQDALVSAIPAARLLVHEGAGHALHWEDPRRCADDLAAFIEGLPLR